MMATGKGASCMAKVHGKQLLANMSGSGILAASTVTAKRPSQESTRTKATSSWAKEMALVRLQL